MSTSEKDDSVCPVQCTSKKKEDTENDIWELESWWDEGWETGVKEILERLEKDGKLTDEQVMSYVREYHL